MNILQEEKEYNNKDSCLDIKHKSDSNENFDNSINGKEIDLKQSNEKIFTEEKTNNNISDFSYSDDKKNNSDKKNKQILQNISLKINPNLSNNISNKKSVKINFNTIDTMDHFQENENVNKNVPKNLTGSFTNMKEIEEKKEEINKSNHENIYIDDHNITRNFPINEIDDSTSQLRIILNKMYYSSNCIVYYIIIVILTVLSVLYSVITHIKKYEEKPSIIFDIVLLSIMTVDVLFKIFLKVRIIIILGNKILF